jgi:hypothetical protein
MATAYPPLIIPLSVALPHSPAEGVLDAIFLPVGDHDEQVPLASAEGGLVTVHAGDVLALPPVVL